MNEVVVSIPPRRVVHAPTGDEGTVLGVDERGYQVVLFDGDSSPLSMRDDVLTPMPEVKR